MLLNLLRVENANPEYMITRSFYQYQNQLDAPQIRAECEKLRYEIDSISVFFLQFDLPSQIENEKLVSTVAKMRDACEKVEEQMRAIAITPKYVLPFLQNGRLVRIRDRANDFGWGVIVGFSKNKNFEEGSATSSVETKYIVDAILYVRFSAWSEL